MCRQRPLFCSRWLSNTAPSTKGPKDQRRKQLCSEFACKSGEAVVGGRQGRWRFCVFLTALCARSVLSSLPYLYMIRFCVFVLFSIAA